MLPANDTVTQFYDDKYAGTDFERLDKAALHTTETRGWPGYNAGASAPNATYHPKLRTMRTHFSWDRSSRALRNPAATPVRENDDNVFQLEIICYSNHALAKQVGGLWVGDLTDDNYSDIASILRELNRSLGLPLKSSVTWREGQKTYVSGVRLSSAKYDAYMGILGHVHVSGNTHWDPGGFFFSKLAEKLGLITPPRPPLPPPPRDIVKEAVVSLPTLKRGSRGNAVRRLQGILLSHGYDLGPYGPRRNGVDGIFGNKVDAAVRHFQVKNRVRNSVVNGRGDGIVGDYTWIELIEA